MNRIRWILNVPHGPERTAIERLLRACGEWPAATGGGSWGTDSPQEDSTRVITVGDGVLAGATGIPGTVAPGEDYLAESPMGQVLAALARRRAITETFARRRGWTRVRRDVRPELSSGWYQGALALGGDIEHGSDYVGFPWVGWFEPPKEVRLVAASHFIWAAYRGACPGVDPEEFRRWRVAAIAESEGLSEEAVLADIEAARQRIADAEYSSLSWVDPTGVCQGCGNQVADLTDNGDAWDYCVCPRVADTLGEDVPASLGQAVAEASALYGQECLFELSTQGRRLIVCQGRPDTIRAFVEVWGPANGLHDLYGSPALGVAQGRATE